MLKAKTIRINGELYILHEEQGTYYVNGDEFHCSKDAKKYLRRLYDCSTIISWTCDSRIILD